MIINSLGASRTDRTVSTCGGGHLEFAFALLFHGERQFNNAVAASYGSAIEHMSIGLTCNGGTSFEGGVVPSVGQFDGAEEKFLGFVIGGVHHNGHRQGAVATIGSGQYHILSTSSIEGDAILRVRKFAVADGVGDLSNRSLQHIQGHVHRAVLAMRTSTGKGNGTVASSVKLYFVPSERKHRGADGAVNIHRDIRIVVEHQSDGAVATNGVLNMRIVSTRSGVEVTIEFIGKFILQNGHLNGLLSVGVDRQRQGHHAVATGNGVAVINIGVSARSGFGTKGGIVPSVGEVSGADGVFL